MGHRVAAVDCGTNSIRLLISEVHDDGSLTDVVRLMEIVRLGEGVDATGRLSEAAMERTRTQLARYVDIMLAEKVQQVRMVATSASRDAANSTEFFSMVEELLGTVQEGAHAEVISGTEEAQLSFTGAVTALAPQPDHDPTVCVIDLGGGSTEFVVGKQSGEVLGALSTQMGSVRISERCFHHDPATTTEIDNARLMIREQLELVRAQLPLEQVDAVVGCAGTFTTMVALIKHLPEYLPEEIHGSVMGIEKIAQCTGQMLALNAAQRAAIPVVHPGRADVLGAGTLVVAEIMRIFADQGIFQVTVSENDILDGIVASLVNLN